VKIFIKFLIFVLILGLAGPFVMKGPDGKPMLSLRDFLPDVNQIKADVESMTGSAERQFDRATSSDLNAGKTKVYKWRDSSGNWHLSDRPIAEAGGRDQVMHVDPDANLVEGREPTPEVEQSSAVESSNALSLPMTVSPSQVGKLIDDAKAVQGLMDKRAEQYEGL